MSEEKLESYLMGTLKNLEKVSEKIIQTNGYTKDVEKVRMLTELIREQLKNENISHSARPLR